MPAAAKNSKYFWLLNLLAIIAVFSISAQTMLADNPPSAYRFPLYETPHYVTPGFSLQADLSGAVEIPAAPNAHANLPGHNRPVFLRPGQQPYQAFTITAFFDYTAQYDALKAHTDIIPGLMLPGLGDSYEIYLNNHLIASQWHVADGKITSHRLARGTVYPINPEFFIRGENTLVFRVYGYPSTQDTGLTITPQYVIDDVSRLNSFDYAQTIFAGICLAVAVTFLLFFLCGKEKRLNLWFALAALSIAMYAFFRVGVFKSVIPDYALSLRLEILALFTFVYFTSVLIYTCGKDKFHLDLKAFTGIYAVFCAALLLPGHQFALDLTKAFLLVFLPFIIYVFVFALCIPFVREMHNTKPEGASGLRHLVNALSGTLRGNMLVGAFIPITFALFDQTVFFTQSYQAVVLSQYSFLFFFANVTFALASDTLAAHAQTQSLSDELRALVSKQESELARKSGEMMKTKLAEQQLREAVSKEIRGPLAEIIGAIELRMLDVGMATDAVAWLNRLLEAERALRKKLDLFLGEETAESEATGRQAAAKSADLRYNPLSMTAHTGGTRHLFVINPKSFITLNDLKNFLLSIEMCFSAGHRAEYKVYISRYPRDAYSAVHRYIASTPPEETARVYAVGGDGILFDCLNGLAPFDNAELAPIPYGNANDFVRSFGAENMPLFRDIKQMSKAPSRRVDMMLCGQHYALCSCSIGIEARAVQAFSNAIELINSGKARYFVPLLYKLGAVKSLLDGSLNNMSYQLTIDGTDYTGDYLFINASNIALNGGNCTPNPLAVPDDGLLDVITCKSSTNLNSLRMISAYTSGFFTKFPDYFTHRRVKGLRCESEKLMSVILDGETFYTHSLDLKILPKAVKIVSPNGIGFADFSQPAKGALK